MEKYLTISQIILYASSAVVLLSGIATAILSNKIQTKNKADQNNLKIQLTTTKSELSENKKALEKAMTTQQKLKDKLHSEIGILKNFALRTIYEFIIDSDRIEKKGGILGLSVTAGLRGNSANDKIFELKNKDAYSEIEYKKNKVILSITFESNHLDYLQNKKITYLSQFDEILLPHQSILNDFVKIQNYEKCILTCSIIINEKIFKVIKSHFKLNPSDNLIFVSEKNGLFRNLDSLSEIE
ncbi:MAG: hypothetical protein KAU01_08795 [Candidatus Cloacimonetes bacterium]|nr:hypothetical protein [Candidatus Cloacimonadota bacterium]